MPNQDNPNQTPNVPQPEKDLFVWTAPARPFKKRDREYYITVVAIASIVGLILFLAEGVIPVILLISLIFLFYVLNTVEPENIEYKITSWGVKVAQNRTEWFNFNRFWFSRRFNNQLLIFEMNRLPGRLELVINSPDEEKIREELKKFLVEEEAPPSFFDRSANWIGEKLPGNK